MTCASDTERKKASRLAHLAALILNSSLVLSAISGKAKGILSPYVLLGQMQSVHYSE